MAKIKSPKNTSSNLNTVKQAMKAVFKEMKVLTVDDLKAMKVLTVDDLKAMKVLTVDDLKLVKTMVQVAVDDTIEERGLVTKEDLKYLPTKDEFYEETLKVLKKLDDIETQMKMLSRRTYDNTDRIDDLEKLHPDNRHQFVAV